MLVFDDSLLIAGAEDPAVPYVSALGSYIKQHFVQHVSRQHSLRRRRFLENQGPLTIVQLNEPVRLVVMALKGLLFGALLLPFHALAVPKDLDKRAPGLILEFDCQNGLGGKKSFQSD